jgi:hypothetical protein
VTAHRRLAAVLLLALTGCTMPPRIGAKALPAVPQPMAAYAIPAWNVGGQIVTGCGAGGKACR